MYRPVHFEIVTKNPEKMGEFYASVFGWKIDSSPGGEGGYWLVRTGEEGTAGIDGGIMGEELPQPVINTIEVPSLAETVRAVEAGAGRVVHGPNEIPGVGTHAYCADPDGNLFGVLQPSSEG